MEKKKIRWTWYLKSRALDQMLMYRPRTVRSSSISGRTDHVILVLYQVANNTVFFIVFFLFSSVHIIIQICHIHLHTRIRSYQKDKRTKPGELKLKQHSFGCRWKI